MPNKKDNNPRKTDEEIQFERELNKLKLSAEYGAPFPDKKKELLPSDETEEDFLTRMKELEDAIQNPDKTKIIELLGFPNFPKVENLSDAEVSAALELATTALGNKNIILDVIYPTPDREIYRFITQELLQFDSGGAGAGGMTRHLIYEEHYPNHAEDIKADITEVLHYICRGHKGSLPWRIAGELSLYGEIVLQEEFEAVLASHRDVFQGMSFIGVDSIKVDLDEPKPHAKAEFRFYMDQSSGSPGEVSAEAEFYFELYDDMYLLNRLVIYRFGIE